MMPLSIGRKAREEGSRDVVDLLLDCHQRIRYFSALARRLAEVQASEADVRQAAASVHRYFAESLPLHAGDEELVIEPRLREQSALSGAAASAPPSGAELDAALDRMAREHLEHQPLLARLLELTRALTDAPQRWSELGPELSDVAERLERMLLDHVEHEERTVFPAIAVLSPDTRASMARQIAERRKNLSVAAAH